MERIPLLEELKSEVLRLVHASGAEGNNTPVFDQIRTLEEALRFLLAIANWASDKVASPNRLNQRLKELGLK
jgi:alkyl hydroperoxide reductase subunit AhpF